MNLLRRLFSKAKPIDEESCAPTPGSVSLNVYFRDNTILGWSQTITGEAFANEEEYFQRYSEFTEWYKTQKTISL
ncbi:MAG TPA: hypothetical protein VFM18_18110 [Methanosarcina sp.]|nr:hypothetical protein [Methanosarcina sp.]